MENTNIQLTINDIAMTRDLIDLAFKRGAFGAVEAKPIGILFEKVDQFVRAAMAQAEAENQGEQITQDETAVPVSSETTPAVKTKGK